MCLISILSSMYSTFPCASCCPLSSAVWSWTLQGQHCSSQTSASGTSCKRHQYVGRVGTHGRNNTYTEWRHDTGVPELKCKHRVVSVTHLDSSPVPTKDVWSSMSIILETRSRTVRRDAEKWLVWFGVCPRPVQRYYFTVNCSVWSFVSYILLWKTSSASEALTWVNV